MLFAYIIFLILLSFISFVYISFLIKRIVKNKIGKYVGAVCFVGIAIILFARLYLKEIYISVQNLTLIFVSIYLIISIIENLRNIIKEIFFTREKDMES